MHYIGMSPTIFQIWNIRVVIYPKDHEPAHVHVIGPEAEAKFNIRTTECIENRGFSEKSLKRIKEYLMERKVTLLEAWDEYQK
jgi:hypothetical protein